MDNPAVVFTAPGVVEIEDRAQPALRPGELRLASACSLISTGTELTLLEGRTPPGSRWHQITVFPETPGYCTAGRVIAVGPDVDTAWLGADVASSAWGGHARYVTATLPSLTRLQRPIAPDQAVFATLAQIVLNGLRKSRVQMGEAVVVYGLGLLGQLAVRCCRLAGARPVIAVDPSALRRSCLPADPAIFALDPAAVSVSGAVADLTHGRLADVVFEVTGVPEAIPAEVAALRNQGRLILLSSPSGPTLFDFHDLCNSRSIQIIGVHNSSHPAVATAADPWTHERHAELFVDLVADGDLDLAPLISHRAPGTEAPALYRLLMADRQQAMGVLLTWENDR